MEHFAELARKAKPQWLVVAVFLQFSTYVCTAAVWKQALHCVGTQQSLVSFIPLALATLFADQALPSGGASGISFFVTALTRRGVPTELCMAMMLVSLVAYYVAYLIVALASVALLWFHHAIHVWILLVVGLFCLVAVVIPVGTLLLQHWSRRAMPELFARLPHIRDLLQGFAQAPKHLLRNRSLVATSVLLYVAIPLLDAATLWTMLRAVGQDVSFLVAFPSFVISSIVSTLSPIPLGLGVFEASSTGMLSALGIPVEAALTATLLLRGFTLWLPMLPGLWLARRELR
jgi:glycosyltransferase 2 family protein